MNFFLASFVSTLKHRTRTPFRTASRHRTALLFTLLMLAMIGVTASRAAHAAGANPSLVLPPTASDTARYATSSHLPTAGIVRQRPVAINFDDISVSSKSPASAISVELFDGQQITVDLSRVDTHRNNSYTWFGSIRGHSKGYAILTVVDGQMSATLDLGETGNHAGGRFQVNSSSNGVHLLQQIDPTSFPPDHPPGGVRVAATSAKVAMSGHSEDETDSHSTFDLLPKSDSGTTIDVMVVYSNNTAAAAGSAIGSQIQQAVDTANQVYANSGITTRLRLVAYQQVNYDESGNIDTDLSWLTSNSGVANLRSANGADLVSMFTEGGGYCGSSWIGPSAGSAFSVVNRGCSSSNYSFPHEIGHNFGARHDVYVDASTSPYAYGHGYVDCAEGWRDVMAYPSQCGGTRIPYFSNPNATYGNPPDPLGISSSADVTRVHNQNAVTVANFKQTVVSGGCAYTLSPNSASVSASGISSYFGVTAGSGCAWSATSSDSTWLTIGSNSGTIASGTLYYTVAPNSGLARSGVINVGGQAFTVNQASGCSYSLSPTGANVPATGATGSTALSATSGCAWTASSSASWLTITSATSGTGGTMVAYAAAVNTGVARSANLSVGDSTFLVSQDGAAVSASPLATLSASNLSFGSQQVGKTSKSKTVTLSNSGSGTLTIGSIAQGGANPGDFPMSGTCAVGVSLASGQTCTLVYGFSPTAAGTRTATTSVGTSAGNVTVSMSGNGTTPRTRIK